MDFSHPETTVTSFSITPFTIPDSWEILPSLCIEKHTCGSPTCDVAHAWSLVVKWCAWGLDFRVEL